MDGRLVAVATVAIAASALGTPTIQLAPSTSRRRADGTRAADVRPLVRLSITVIAEVLTLLLVGTTVASLPASLVDVLGARLELRPDALKAREHALPGVRDADRIVVAGPACAARSERAPWQTAGYGRWPAGPAGRQRGARPAAVARPGRDR